MTELERIATLQNKFNDKDQSMRFCSLYQAAKLLIFTNYTVLLFVSLPSRSLVHFLRGRL